MKISFRRYFLSWFIEDPISVFLKKYVFRKTFEKFSCGKYFCYIFLPSIWFFWAEDSLFLLLKYLAEIFSTKKDITPKKQYTIAIEMLIGLASIGFMLEKYLIYKLTDLAGALHYKF